MIIVYLLLSFGIWYPNNITYRWQRVKTSDKQNAQCSGNTKKLFHCLINKVSNFFFFSKHCSYVPLTHFNDRNQHYNRTILSGMFFISFFLVIGGFDFISLQMATIYDLSEVLIDYLNFKIKRDEMHKRFIGSHVQEQLN